MRYSIVICTHNRCQVLARALRSQAEVRTPEGASVELIVVDNASADDTRRVVEAFAGAAPFPVRCITEPRLGHSFALNKGTVAATGDVIVFTDDDALPKQHWLRQIDLVFRRSQADWVFGRVFPVWPAEQPSWFSPQLNRYFALLDYGPDPFVVSDRKHTFFGVNHACRRSAIESLGGYRTDRGIYGGNGMGLGVGNDVDLFERALDAGMKIVYDPAIEVGHMIPASRATKTYNRRTVWLNTRNFYQHLRNHPPKVPWLLGLPRYYYRLALGRALGWLKSALGCDQPAAFAQELELVRFAGLFIEAWRFWPNLADANRAAPCNAPRVGMLRARPQDQPAPSCSDSLDDPFLKSCGAS
jgi:glycosyltransferase involved in cell wall biosynthesis